MSGYEVLPTNTYFYTGGVARLRKIARVAPPEKPGRGKACCGRYQESGAGA
jgi:hypothetical protein